MAESELQIEGLFLNKPECAVNLPEWLLPTNKINRFRSMSSLAIVEIAGRDSVAAAIKCVEEGGFTDLLPTYVYTGTEYGTWSTVKEAVRRLSDSLSEVKIHDLLVLGSPKFWQVLNGRFISELIEKYRFYTPCVGCHLYLHGLRIPIAIALGNVPIVSGEREMHNGDIKINQIAEALNLYQGLAEEFRVKLLFPLRHISGGDRIEDILGFHWGEGEDQLKCVLSGNYRQPNGTNKINKEDAIRYLEHFGLPCARKIIKSYVKGHVPDHIEIAKAVLKTI